LRKDVEVIERVQRRATRIIDECRAFEYCKRLKETTKLTTLKTRAIMGDMIEVFKIMNGWESAGERFLQEG